MIVIIRIGFLEFEPRSLFVCIPTFYEHFSSLHSSNPKTNSIIFMYTAKASDIRDYDYSLGTCNNNEIMWMKFRADSMRTADFDVSTDLLNTCTSMLSSTSSSSSGPRESASFRLSQERKLWG